MRTEQICRPHGVVCCVDFVWDWIENRCIRKYLFHYKNPATILTNGTRSLKAIIPTILIISL